MYLLFPLKFKRYFNYSYLLSISLLDKDECKAWGYCDQLCVNTVDNYQCLCDIEYERVTSENKCKVRDSYPKMMLFFAYHDRILKVCVFLCY